MREIAKYGSSNPDEMRLICYWVLGTELGWQPSEVDAVEATTIDDMLLLIHTIKSEEEFEMRKMKRKQRW